MQKPAAITLSIALLAGCAATPEPLTETTDTSIDRGTGNAITVEDLRANRSDSKALAALLVALDRELQVPSMEQRTAAEVISALEKHALGIDTFNHCVAFKMSRRSVFREFGVLPPQGAKVRTRLLNFTKYVETVLQNHDATTSENQLLDAWRRFSPSVHRPAAAYVASCWMFEMDFPDAITVSLADSVLGPVLRCKAVCDDAVHFGTDQTDIGGYTTNTLLTNLLQPAGESPIQSLLQALRGEPSSIRIAANSGRAATPTEDESVFLSTVIRHLAEGYADIDSIPAGTRRLDVEFSYLIGTEDARARIGFARDGFDWMLDRFEYQPASANLVGDSGATLDVLPLIAVLPAFADTK
ncbi:hypothetical protein OAU50_04935 [Planctomycetota bacterium]|nr:hypothetical protein [Planctomycetota bacterium]